MTRLTHDEYFLQMLALVAQRSTCVRRQVGAILVDAGHHVLSLGYNGVPRGFDHCIDTPCPGAADPSGDTRRCYAVHAEVNAVLQCARLDLARTLYVSCMPCFECAKMLVNTRVSRLVCAADYPGPGAEILKLAGIAVQLANKI